MDRRRLFRFAGALVGGLPLAALGTNVRKTREMIVLDAPIAGFAYYAGAQCLPRMVPGDELRLRREPENLFDRRAIEVSWNDQKIGYVPCAHNRALCQLMDMGERVVGEVKRIDTGR